MFCEDEWIKLVMLLADTQQWIDTMGKELFASLPLAGKQKLQRKTYYLPVTALAHILEKHYYKYPRYPQAGKFHLPIPDIVSLLRDAADTTALPMPGSLNLYRIWHLQQSIGFDNKGRPSSSACIITGPGGNIITAFPVTPDYFPANPISK